MKRSLAVALSVLFLAGTSMVWADSASPKLLKTAKHEKHKKGGKKTEAASGKHFKDSAKNGKVKPALNPQPMPPGVQSPRDPGVTKAQ